MIEKEKGTRDLWHTRNYRGGLVDVEFIAQFLQIVHAADEPEILSQNTARALRNLLDAGILSLEQWETLFAAASLYQNIEQILRLCTDGTFQPETAPRDLTQLLLKVTGEAAIPQLEARLSASYSRVALLFDELVR